MNTKPIYEVGHTETTFNGYKFTVLDRREDSALGWLYLTRISPRDIDPLWLTDDEYKEQWRKHYLCWYVSYEDYYDENGDVNCPPIDLIEQLLRRDSYI